MTFEIELGGRTRSVSVSRGDGPDRYSVTIDGRPLQVGARRIGDFSLVVLTDSVQQAGEHAADKANGRNDFWNNPVTRQLFLMPGGFPGEILVTFEGRTSLVALNGRRRGRAADPAVHADGDQAVIAPMPGRVVRVLVAPGDEVATGQGLVVVEAMKMENELRAGRDGHVAAIHVQEGASVDAGTLLIELKQGR
jgi:biotin carboxyl carrier protein